MPFKSSSATWPRTAAAAVAIGALALGACSGSSSTASATDGGDPAPAFDAAAYCTQTKENLQAMFDIPRAEAVENFNEMFDRFKQTFTDMANDAPPEIKADVEKMASSLAGITTEADLESTEASPEAKAAADRVDVWFKEHCGYELDDLTKD
jgi:rubrerythrin